MTATADAAEPGSAAVWDECPDNVSNLFEAGDRAATDAAFARRRTRRQAAATSSPACTRSSWSRAARSASGTRGEDRYTLYADVQYPHRVRNALATNIFKVPEHRIRVDRGRRRRRLRHQGLAVSRAPARAVGRAQAAAGRSSGRASAARRFPPTSTRATTSPRPSWRSTPTGRFLALRVAHARQRRRLRLVRPQPARDVQQCRHAGRRLHVPGRARRRCWRAGQHQLHRALSRRRPARGDLRHRAADRRRGPRARPRPGRAAADEPDPALGDARTRRRSA